MTPARLEVRRPQAGGTAAVSAVAPAATTSSRRVVRFIWSAFRTRRSCTLHGLAVRRQRVDLAAVAAAAGTCAGAGRRTVCLPARAARRRAAWRTRRRPGRAASASRRRGGRPVDADADREALGAVEGAGAPRRRRPVTPPSSASGSVAGGSGSRRRGRPWSGRSRRGRRRRPSARAPSETRDRRLLVARGALGADAHPDRLVALDRDDHLQRAGGDSRLTQSSTLSGSGLRPA